MKQLLADAPYLELNAIAFGAASPIAMVEVGFSYNNLSLDVCLEQYVD
ncbi:MAG: hypothetical protein F6J90_09740 [Moorea sp. SIOASIH]|nr:hypothetical protein [Moorena sp. SIOASIH]NEO36590.1 hypothetical protein [Moorena sp. SIOASIH]